MRILLPLRAEWKEVQVAALTYEGQGKHKEAVAEIRAFHRHLCDVRVLDPACGSGNFIVQILRRKLAAVDLKYGKSDFERRHYALLALMS